MGRIEVDGMEWAHPALATVTFFIIVLLALVQAIINPRCIAAPRAPNQTPHLSRMQLHLHRSPNALT